MLQLKKRLTTLGSRIRSRARSSLQLKACSRIKRTQKQSATRAVKSLGRDILCLLGLAHSQWQISHTAATFRTSTDP